MAVEKIQPPYLKEGDEVVIISPSYCVDENVLHNAVEFLESWGLKVRQGKNMLKRNGPFAGSDEERLNDLQEMTDDSKIKAVFCSRGGYGLSKIIDRIDFSKLRTDPKWYSGFSDVTVLHLWLNEVCGVMSIHGEMPVNFTNTGKSIETFTSLKNALFGSLRSHEWTGNFYRPGNVTGEVTGGNLSLLSSLTGTKGDPSTAGKILFIEEVGEYYYRIDRMLTSLKLAGKLEGLAALIIGGMNKIDDANIAWGKSIEETIAGITEEYAYPLLFNFPAGHISDNRALYIGRQAKIEIEGNRASLIYL